jgi:hypothetical protein
LQHDAKALAECGEKLWRQDNTVGDDLFVQVKSKVEGRLDFIAADLAKRNLVELCVRVLVL